MKSFVLTLPGSLNRLCGFMDSGGTKLGTEPFLAPELDDPEVIALAVRPGNTYLKEASHKLGFARIIEEALRRELDSFIIFEDDARFRRDPLSILKQLKTLPDNFGICYLGAYFQKDKCANLKAVRYSSELIKLSGSAVAWGSHAVAFHKNSYELSIKLLKDKSTGITDKIIPQSILPVTGGYLLDPQSVFQDVHSVGMHGKYSFVRLEQNSVAVIKEKTG